MEHEPEHDLRKARYLPNAAIKLYPLAGEWDVEWFVGGYR
jgi:hypothetical protein